MTAAQPDATRSISQASKLSNTQTPEFTRQVSRSDTLDKGGIVTRRGSRSDTKTLAETRHSLEALLHPPHTSDFSQVGTDHLRRILAAVIAATGFGASFFKDADGAMQEMAGRSLDDREFVTRLLHLVVFSLDIQEPQLLDRISVPAIVAGQDPAAAYLLLQKLVDAATSKEALKRWGKDHDTLQRKWSDRWKTMPLPDSVRIPLSEVQAVVERLSWMAAQLEVLTEELIGNMKAAGLDALEMCRQIKMEVFSAAAVMRDPTNTRGMTSYANKHIVGDPSHMYDVGDVVGSGAFGSVHKAIHKATGQNHVVKIIPKSKVNASSLWAEMDIMKQLDHPHIMRLHNTFEDGTYMYMSSELCVGGPFFDTLSKAGYLKENLARILFKQIAGVVSYLHARSICHRDIKPENFLVLRPANVEHLHLKLIDFGTAKRFDLESMITKVCTPHYVAPEVLSAKNDAYSEKVDIWSCGVILFVMLSGRLPFHRDNHMELLKMVRKAKFEFEPQQIWKNVSENAHDLISRILTANVIARLTAEEVFHHAWLMMHEPGDEEGHKDISKEMIAQIHRFLTNNRLKRVALRIIARQIDDDAIDQQRSVWLSVDEDNSGTLTLDEMQKAVMQLDVSEMTKKGMVEIMSQLDPTGEGHVEYTEFLAACLDKKQYMQEDVCRAAFVRLDFDGDGIVSRKDLGRLLSDKDGMRDAGLSGASLCELIDELENIMSDADGNNDGGVSFEEFMLLMNDEGPLPSRSAVSMRRQRHSQQNYALDMKQIYETGYAEYVDEMQDLSDGLSAGSD
jgi:calcium-dependent protein kinase